MIQKERTEKILKILRSKDVVSIKFLCDTLFCSKSTIRRDLIELEDENLVRRSRGGVVLIKQQTTEFSDNFRSNTNKLEKNIIASIAKTFIKNDMSLFLDSSSTVNALTPYLSNFSNLKIITNGIKTAINLITMKNIDTYVSCGKLKGMSSSLIGDECCEYISRFNTDITFISCRYLDENFIYEANPAQAIPKKYMMQNSKKTILLADHTKFNQTSLFKIAPLEAIDLIITDKAIDDFDSLNKINTKTKIITTV